MTEAVWLLTLFALPLVVFTGSWTKLRDAGLRRLAVTCAIALVTGTSLAFVVPGLRGLAFGTVPGLAGDPFVRLVRVDELAAALLCMTSILWLLGVAVTPRAALDRAALRRTALATMVTLATFCTESALALVVLWTISVALFLWALPAAQRRARRIAAIHLGAATVAFALGVACLSWPGSLSPALGAIGIWLVVVAALIRKGVFPFHAWVPEVFDHGRLGPAILFSAPQIGAYVTAVLVIPRAPPEALRVVAVLALLTAVYGAALAVVQSDARRACGYLFVSQSALVMAGLDCTSDVGLAGGLTLWLSSAIAFAGLARCVLLLEGRRGRLPLTRFHGGYEHKPELAIAFLLTGLACTGFPGTLGFVGDELLVDGAVEEFPILGFAVVIAGALTGIAVLRMYLALFCGRRQRASHLGLRPREAWGLAALTVLLVAAGLVPGPIVRSRVTAAEDLLHWRHALRD
jgi:NADH-quinone oxidoreductase subunit M